MRYNKNVGDSGEDFAVKMLEESGYVIMERNYWTRAGEIDIVARKDGIIHFIEVKTRNGDAYGYPSDSITESKRLRMRRSAECYLSQRRMSWRNVSIDVYEVMTNLIENCV